ncbi:hypothetical protein CVT26_001110 [Gymnopilus dilepis]|uniref:Uncharacterized protein n=1 Tax=Gymnopilus dilepis TaxID=231916 RepID=A0A409X5U3_9AGAR|nr:hypothetical protein CVT26_001110 [Gymnopilus dilepis]
MALIISLFLLPWLKLNVSSAVAIFFSATLEAGSQPCQHGQCFVLTTGVLLAISRTTTSRPFLSWMTLMGLLSSSSSGVHAIYCGLWVNPIPTPESIPSTGRESDERIDAKFIDFGKSCRTPKISATHLRHILLAMDVAAAVVALNVPALKGITLEKLLLFIRYVSLTRNVIEFDIQDNTRPPEEPPNTVRTLLSKLLYEEEVIMGLWSALKDEVWRQARVIAATEDKIQVYKHLVCCLPRPSNRATKCLHNLDL